MKTKLIAALMLFTIAFIGCKKSGGQNDPNNPNNPNVLNIVTNNTSNTIGQTIASIGGNITSDGGTPIIARGICWHTATAPTIANNKIQVAAGIGSFTANLIGLANSTTYYARAYATTSATTVYGTEISFTTQPLTVAGAGVTDIEGNVYPTVKIADKEWMAANLRTAKYRNGDAIPNITLSASWASATTGAWCFYDNITGYNNTYGKLYNWYAVKDVRELAPTGWHIPSLGEWSTLESNFGSNSIAGGALKKTGTSEWEVPNTYATNLSNFTALPGGDRSPSNGSFERQGKFGYWWTASEVNSLYGRSVYLSHNNGYLNSNSDGKAQGAAVRCVKD